MSSRILRYFRDVIDQDYESIGEMSAQLVLPKFDRATTYQCIHESISMIQQDPIVLKINQPSVIVGDLHGHIVDLFRIIFTNGFPPDTNYLFLGDIVDRGEFSYETAIFVLALKAAFPKNVFIVRGNHECDAVCRTGGFYQQVCEIYDDFIYDQFLEAFDYLPLAAVFSDKFLCVHAGIGPNFTSLDQIRNLERPIHDPTAIPALCDLLWSDPSGLGLYSPSFRGYGVVYGQSATVNFLRKNHLSRLIRGHEMTQIGVEESHCSLVLTVFSASGYCGRAKNCAGTLHIDGDQMLQTQYDVVCYPMRSDTMFKEIKAVASSSAPTTGNFEGLKKFGSDFAKAPTLLLPPLSYRALTERSHNLPIAKPPVVKPQVYLGAKSSPLSSGTRHTKSFQGKLPQTFTTPQTRILASVW